MYELESALTQGLALLGLPADGGFLSPFRRYYDFLSNRNAVMDLTAILGEADVARLHFLDSLFMIELSALKSKRVIDVGSGAGFPGLPLKLAVRSMRLTLLDAQEKRVKFLTELCGLLGLDDVSTIHARAEEASKLETFREYFDVALSRAVAEFNVLSELCLPFVALGGIFVAMKAVNSDDEIASARSAIETLGGEIERIRDYNIPGTDIWHRTVIVRKTDATPPIYPRRYAKIRKSPL